MNRIHVDPDIRRANGLPPALYFDGAWFDLLRDAVFARTWHCLGSTAGLDTRGAVRPETLLPGCLDEPLVLVRGDRGLSCYSNVCTHRGHPVVEEGGCQAMLRCRYHGRRFNLDGRLTGMPGFEGAERFPGPSDDLQAVPLERFAGLAFTSLDPAAPFARWIDPIGARAEALGIEGLTHEPQSDRTYQFEANWILYVDNYLEGLHIPHIHGGLASRIDCATYRTELFELASVQIAEAAPGEPAFEIPGDGPDRAPRIAAFYYWLFPSTMLNFYPWGLSLNVVEPLGPTRTRVRFQTFVGKPELRERGAGSGLDVVEAEDEAAVEAVQRGVRSRFAVRARYSPEQETGTHHFHRLLARFVNERIGLGR